MHLIFGTGSTGRITTSQISKLRCVNALYRPPENLDAIALIGQGYYFVETLTSKSVKKVLEKDSVYYE